MGTIKQGILGGVSGSVGSVVGSSWKGIAVIKAKPLSVANPKTAGQVLQRGKMTMVVMFATAILSAIIKPLWDRFAIRKSGYNSFVQTNIGLFDENSLVTPASLKISTGKMTKTQPAVSTLSSGGKAVPITFTDDSGEDYKLETDQAFAVCYNPTTGEIATSETGKTRADEDVTVTFLADYVTGTTIHVYLAFRRANGTIVSETGYLATVVSD